MKQKDIALVCVVAFMSIIVATLVSNMLFSGAKPGSQEAETVDAITATFTQPDTRYFNSNSVDPTETIRIGDNSNQTPFKQAE